MLNIRKHISMDQTPEFVNYNSSQSSDNVTPTKQLGIHNECIDQLSKWHALCRME